MRTRQLHNRANNASTISRNFSSRPLPLSDFGNSGDFYMDIEPMKDVSDGEEADDFTGTGLVAMLNIM